MVATILIEGGLGMVSYNKLTDETPVIPGMCLVTKVLW